MKTQMKRCWKKSNQSGSLMIEMALYLAVSAILLTSQIAKVNQDLEASLSVGTGQYLTALQSGVNKYVLDNASSLTSNPLPSSFTNNGVTFSGTHILQPTIADLTNATYLPLGFGNVSPLGLSFKITLAQTGTCPGAGCNVTGFGVSTAPYKDATGALRTDVLTDAVRTVGIDAGMSYAEAPGTLRGYGGSWSAPNPTGDAGRLAIRVGSDSGIAALLAQFYKTDGTRPLAGTMNAANNDINNVKNLTAQNIQISNTATIQDAKIAGNTFMNGVATAGSACLVSEQNAVRRNANQTGLVVCGNGLWQTVGNAIAGISAGSACSLTGQLGTNELGVAFICNGTTFESLLPFRAAPGSACAQPGTTAVSTVDSEQLVCKGSPAVYQKLTDLLGKTVEYDRLNVQDKNIVVFPPCAPGGVPGYSFDTRQSLTDMGIVPPRQLLVYGANLIAGGWTISIKLKNDVGSFFGTGPVKDVGDPSPNAPYNLTAVLRRECTY
ncbi:MAG: hypothetical protein Q7K26_01930 [bacterium]|nr:hypothetical protein [bacterium]